MQREFNSTEIRLLNPKTLEEMVKLGISVKQIAKDTNSDIGTIYNRLKEYRIKRNKKAEKAWRRKNCYSTH